MTWTVADAIGERPDRGADDYGRSVPMDYEAAIALRVRAWLAHPPSTTG